MTSLKALGKVRMELVTGHLTKMEIKLKQVKFKMIKQAQ
jgi:hypothetical protein